MSRSQLKRIGELDLAEDFEFERRSWTVQRIAWILMTLILLAALLGLFGNGWLSKAKVSDARGNVQIEYDRYVRNQSPMELLVRFSREAVSEDSVGVWLSREYLQPLELKHITPEPSQELAAGDGIVFIFDVQGQGEPPEAVFRFEVQSPWTINGSAALANSEQALGEKISFKHWAYP